MALESWSTHAVLYEIDPHGFYDLSGPGSGNLRGVTEKLDYIHSLGVDAIALTHIVPAGEADASHLSIDPALGTQDDFDDLLREASRDGIRVVVEVEADAKLSDSALPGLARFWLSRGVAGISLRGPAQGSARTIPTRPLREAIRSFAGQRILVADSGLGEGPDLTLNSTLAAVPSFTAGAFRAALGHLQPASAGTLSMTDSFSLAHGAPRYESSNPADAMGSAKVLATFLLATRANAQLAAGQELGRSPAAPLSNRSAWGDVAAQEADADSVLNWYRRLIDLHHGNATMRSGTIDLLNHDDQGSVVWVTRRGAVSAASPAIVVACNLTNKPVTLSLLNDLGHLHLRGSFLRTVLRSDNGMGGMNLDAVTLPPFGIYIGELRF